MEIDLEPQYRNYWLDLARKEEREKNEAKRKEALSRLVSAIDLVAHKNNKKNP